MANKKSSPFKLFKQLNPRTGLLIFLLIAIFVIVIIYSIFTLIFRIGKTQTIIRFAPSSAIITLNDTTVANNSTNWFIPGKYRLKVRFNSHFEVYEEDIEIKEGETAEFYGTLSALDKEGEEYISNHSEDYTITEGLVGKLLNKRGQKQKEKYPILKYLPMNNSLYSISYQYDENDEPVINVKSEPKYIDVAVAKMHLFKNVDLNTQNIVFYLNNPYEKYQQNPIKDPVQFIRSAYQLSDDYKIKDIQQVEDYYYTTIYYHDPQTGDDYSHYHIILKKNSDNEWESITNPQPLLTTHNTPNVNKEILNTINSY